MADDPTKYLPFSVEQNPSFVRTVGQQWKDACRDQVERILEVFFQVIPSNYFSQTMGPYYTLQFQAAAEQIAKIQVVAQEVYYDSDFDFTRPEFLFQILGSLVFPDQSRGIPQIDGDVSYRAFLKRMVILLLQGATKQTVKEGVELVTDGTVEVIEKAIAARETANSAWGFDEQFEFEINISAGDNFDAFPTDPFVTQKNVELVIRALKPAHTLYTYRHLFKDAFGTLFQDTMSWDMEMFYYEDFRKYCLGAKEITSTVGETLTDRRLFSDPTRDFSSIQVGSTLEIFTGPNIGVYRVEEILVLPFGTDATARAYTTSPTALSGTVTVSNNDLTDSSQDFRNAVEGEIITITAGPNAGKYRLDTLLGTEGGPVGFSTAANPITQVRLSPSILRLNVRMPQTTTGQTYSVSVDRLGVQTPKDITSEDVSIFFVS